MFKILRYKNKYKNKDIFILGNAPSIKKENLEPLKNSISIGMNASPLLEKEYGFTSQFYVVSDTRFMENEVKRKIATEMVNKSTVRVFRKELIDYDDPSLKRRTCYIRAIGKNGFSFNLVHGYYFGCTTTMLAIQLAYYIGGKNIYLLGNDLKYSKNNARFYNEDKVQVYDKFTSIQIYNMKNAYNILKEKRVNLYNCSSTSLLAPYLPFKLFKNLHGEYK
ncbi:MAG: DUF115 domain-containing protein [bacterium]|nr:DUF115 domain-containing protein [bacterium]